MQLCFEQLAGKHVHLLKEVKADSLQNPNDPDATYRAKNDQKVQCHSSKSQSGRDSRIKFEKGHYKDPFRKGLYLEL